MMGTIGTITDKLSGRALTLETGGNLFINAEAFAQLGSINSLDEDLIRLAAFVYAADLAVSRREREQHLRSIVVRVPVVNIQAFERVRALLEQALTTVSVDNWTLEFVPITEGSPARSSKWPAKREATLMFSGGIDSFAGAIELLKNNDEITLVSHVTHNLPVKNAQVALAKAVQSATKKQIVHLQVRVSGRNYRKLKFPADHEREDTQRTRSFLFTALAAVAARLDGSRRIIVMAENGQFAIHLPLTAARIGSFSTHTAHPKFLATMQEVLRQLYVCNDLEVVNPFVHLTKGEVVALIPDAVRPQIKESSSCWRVARVSASATHCGECVPCLSRRIALEKNDIHIAEYHRDLLSLNVGKLPEDDLGKRNLIDLCQFITLFEGKNRLRSDDDVCYEFPELFEQCVDRTQVIAMYRRFAKEAFAVLRRYKYIEPLLK
jgi:7-cyano-7-deazaguanine synthase in queuosine biosynthesis